MPESPGYGIFVATGPDEYPIAGDNLHAGDRGIQRVWLYRYQ